jgi:hypothetical protein
MIYINNNKRGSNFMNFKNKKFLENYLKYMYGEHEIRNISHKVWTSDLLIIFPNKTHLSVEVKEREITKDYILDADDIAVEIMQDYAFYDKFGAAPFDYAKLDAHKFHKSLGWIYTEISDRLIYIKYINTETKIGYCVYDLDFAKFKTHFVMEILPNMDKYKIQRNNSQTKSKSQSFNVLVPIKDIPKIQYERWEKIVER